MPKQPEDVRELSATNNRMGAHTLGGDIPVRNIPWALELLRLPPNWDSYEARQISVEALMTVGRFAVVPMSHGGVQLEIHYDGYDIEIEIGPAGEIQSALVAHETVKI